MTHFDIVPVDPGDPAQVRARLAVMGAVDAHDHAGTRHFNPAHALAASVVGRNDVRSERWVAVCDGRVLGYADATMPLLDNTHSVYVDLGVHPDERRRGVGSGLLRHVEERAAEEGRSALSTWILAPGEGAPEVRTEGAAFAVGKGYQLSLNCAVRAVELDTVDEAALDRLWDEVAAKAADFDLVAFEGLPPERIIDGMAYLHARMYTDMPLGEWDLQEAAIDRDRLAGWSEMRRLRGELHLQVAAVHRESGEVAGFTEIIVEAGSEFDCFQGDTIVDPRFRGHRLGTLLKIANQRAVRSWRPRMRFVWTGNAVSNDHMIAINESVGYRLVCEENVYQKKR
ncbi:MULTISPECIES: GNAT family N-acetyltransferase [Glycomyces]|uniref:GNAT family N-acetyltransferase n=2 Tax=Glycomyces TaxID=58113 RepID=A0A9X3PET6_9ACTN|nr:GNAT family N-acetyltransferase [Glycomyces lechevalierae]MDA1384156.1 GNAT family N-acetyltransferase [Glycomyces lechevalierae]MDR7339414.1 GNAT superfamily N-acetyltransferase [Glycomyces lechevalierae]